MNIVAARRAVKALEKKVKRMESAQSRAKDKQRWLKKNEAGLKLARRQLEELRVLILRELARQGFFDHAAASKAGAPDA